MTWTCKKPITCVVNGDNFFHCLSYIILCFGRNRSTNSIIAEELHVKHSKLEDGAVKPPHERRFK